MMTMTKSALVQARMEPDLKEKGDAVWAGLGISASTAISLFYTQAIRQGGIPMELKVLNEETKAAVAELRDPEIQKTAKRYSSAGDMLADLTT